MQDVMKIDFSQPFAKRLAANPAEQEVFFIQNGINYDSAGNACDKKQIKAHYAGVAAHAQKEADDAMAAYEAAQAQADELMAATIPANPKTVAELTDALTDAGVEIPEGSLKPALEDLWELEKAKQVAAEAA